jgi:ubiquinone/menaquinone biosynthesis C-methylase UbiE
MDNNEHFDNWAPTYDNSIVTKSFFEPVHSKMLRIISSSNEFKSPISILDVGCGTGRLLRTASRKWPSEKLFGVDLSENMITQAKHLAPNISFQIAPAEAIPIPDQTIDLALSSISFHHWKDPQKGLSEILRTLRPGGCFCLADQTMPGWLARIIRSDTKSKDTINSLLNRVGFTLIKQDHMFGNFILITLVQKSADN